MKLKTFLRNTENPIELQAAAIWTNRGYELTGTFGEYSCWTLDTEPAFLMRYNHEKAVLEVKPLQEWAQFWQSVIGSQLSDVYEFSSFGELFGEKHFQVIAE